MLENNKMRNELKKIRDYRAMQEILIKYLREKLTEANSH